MVDYEPYILIGSILLLGLVAGLFINRLILPRTNRYLARRKIRAPRIIIRTLQNFVQFWTILGSLYVISYLFLQDFSYYQYIKIAFTVIVIVSVFYYIYKSITTINTYYIRSGKLPDTTLFNNVLKLVLVLVASLFITNRLGYSVVPIVATFGVGALAIALALQDSLANLFAGISIVASKQINIGDYVRLDDQNEGYIHDISWRYTVIRTLQNNLIVIPNSVMASHTLINFSLPQKTMRVLIPIRVAYSVDMQHVEDVTLSIAREYQQNFEGADRNFEPRLRFIALGDYGIDFNVVLGITQYEVQNPLRSEFLKRVHKTYRELGIGIPFPTHSILFEDKKPETDEPKN